MPAINIRGRIIFSISVIHLIESPKYRVFVLIKVSLDTGVYRRVLETLATIGLKAHRREC